MSSVRAALAASWSTTPTRNEASGVRGPPASYMDVSLELAQHVGLCPDVVTQPFPGLGALAHFCLELATFATVPLQHVRQHLLLRQGLRGTLVALLDLHHRQIDARIRVAVTDRRPPKSQALTIGAPFGC